MRTARCHRNSRSRAMRAWSAFAIAILLGANLSSYLHKSTERHAVCPEHGELIHVDDHSASSGVQTSARDAVVERHERGIQVRPTESGDSEHEHEHCYLCPSSRDRLHTPHVALVVGDAIARDYRFDGVRPVHPDQSAVYALAPKTSPPV